MSACSSGTGWLESRRMPIFPDIIVAGLTVCALHWREITWFWFSALLAASVILLGGYAVLGILAVAVIAVMRVAGMGTTARG